ncbi:MAG: sugar phosphate isomerase/epimerase family protein [Candidatus Firestonebacteria bacterium]
MFKLATFGDEISQDLNELVKICKQQKVGAVELRSTWNKGPHQLNKTEIKTIRDKFRDNGIKTCSIAAPFFKCDIDSPKEIQEHYDILNRCSELAHALGTKIVRGFTFWRKGDFDVYYQRILDNFVPVVKLAKKNKIIIGVENEAACFVGTGRQLGRFLSDVNSPLIRATWDPANEIHDNYFNETPFPTGFSFVKKYLIHFHMKDSIRMGESGKPECVPVGEGDINYWGQFKALKDMGYNGYVSLETHWRMKVAKMSEETVNRPGGAAYTAGAAESSIYCLQNIKKIIKSL